jgi:hypothetical protein
MAPGVFSFCACRSPPRRPLTRIAADDCTSVRAVSVKADTVVAGKDSRTEALKDRVVPCPGWPRGLEWRRDEDVRGRI